MPPVEKAGGSGFDLAMAAICSAVAAVDMGNVPKLLYQTHSPKEPYIYCQGNNDLVHLGCL
jgi:hypothetical protein